MQNASGKAVSNSNDDGKKIVCECCGNTYTTKTGLSYHYKSENNDCSGVTCPSCNDSHFVTTRGMKWHHKMSHGESLYLQTTTCDNCGVETEKEERHINKDGHNFCSKDCQGQYLTKKEVAKCEYCQDDYKVPPCRLARTKFCSEECKDEWTSENNVGENHPQYKGGSNYYGENWFKQRRKVRERDNYRCQSCGKHESDHDRELSIHHIKPIRTFDKPENANALDNLVTLCCNCHPKWEGIPLKPQIIPTS